MDENILESLPEEQRELMKQTTNVMKKAFDEMQGAKSIYELQAIYLKHSLPKGIDEIGNIGIDAFKTLAASIAESLPEGYGRDKIFIEKFKNTKNVDEMKQLLAENFDKEYAGKSLEEIKTAMKNSADDLGRKSGKYMFEQFWDSSKKTFVNCEEGVGAAVKKAAKSI